MHIKWSHRRFLYLVLFGALLVLVAIAIVPVSTRLLRAGSLTMSSVVWLGIVGLCWHRRALRATVLGITVLMGGFLLAPARSIPDASALRAEYVGALRRYEGVTYVWGGESFGGIDCSGLVRRGLIDALLQRGLVTLDPGLVRRGLLLWWNDCTASALGQSHASLTSHLLDTSSVNELDPSNILPGDLAVTRNGVHIMAYLGENQWIEADPGERKVLKVHAPATDNIWFKTPMRIIRWNILVR